MSDGLMFLVGVVCGCSATVCILGFIDDLNRYLCTSFYFENLAQLEQARQNEYRRSMNTAHMFAGAPSDSGRDGS